MTYTPIMLGLAVTQLLGFFAPIQAPTDKTPRTATVHVAIVDGLGTKLEGGKIESFRDLRTGRDLAKAFHVDRFHENLATGIPYGHYDLRLRQPGFPETERPVDVFEPDLSVRVSVRTATVHLVTVGPSGRGLEVGIKVESFRSTEDGVDLASRFTGGTGTQIPYGIYHLKRHESFVWEPPRRVDVFQPEVWVVIGVEIWAEVPEYVGTGYELTGTINNITPDEEPVYVRLLGVYLNFSADEKVAVSGFSGTFALAGFNPQGKYVLVTTGRSGILDLRQVELPSKSPVVIDLAQAGTLPKENH